MEEIKKTTKSRDCYEIECKDCGKKITGISVKQVRHNFKLHQIFCKDRKKEVE